PTAASARGARGRAAPGGGAALGEQAPPAEATAPAGAASEGGGDAAAAFRAVLGLRPPVVPGPLTFLRAADVAEPEPGRVRILLPAGPGLDNLAGDVAARRGLARALSARLGREIEVEIASQGPAQQGPQGRPRLTPEKVRADRLSRLVREEPVLGRAVEELDLELLD
ncbi:MAG: hypothetical protein ACRELD_11265, partial [Longimicrobiales bacterium]